MPLTERSLGLCTITADPHVRRPYHGAYHTYLGIFGIQATTTRLHFNYKTSTTANMEPIPLDDPIKYLGIVC